MNGGGNSLSIRQIARHCIHCDMIIQYSHNVFCSYFFLQKYNFYMKSANKSMEILQIRIYLLLLQRNQQTEVTPRMRMRDTRYCANALQRMIMQTFMICQQRRTLFYENVTIGYRLLLEENQQKYRGTALYKFNYFLQYPIRRMPFNGN